MIDLGDLALLHERRCSNGPALGPDLRSRRTDEPDEQERRTDPQRPGRRCGSTGTRSSRGTAADPGQPPVAEQRHPTRARYGRRGPMEDLPRSRNGAARPPVGSQEWMPTPLARAPDPALARVALAAGARGRRRRGRPGRRAHRHPAARLLHGGRRLPGAASRGGRARSPTSRPRGREALGAELAARRGAARTRRRPPPLPAPRPAPRGRARPRGRRRSRTSWPRSPRWPTPAWSSRCRAGRRGACVSP